MISIHALREEGDVVRDRLRPAFRISIHALREEGDAPLVHSSQSNVYFYPRPPRGGRQGTEGRKHRTNVFLSTPSARRATAGETVRRTYLWISIHALREEGDAGELVAGADESISIHALREEGD